MTDLATLRDLLERVKAATGPDRELDAAIYNAAPEKVGDKDFCAFRLPMDEWGDRFDDGWRIGWEGRQYPEKLPRLTASIDAALALVERVLTGHIWDVTSTGQCWIEPDLGRPDHWNGTAATPPLAILAATLAALIEQEAS